MKRLQRILNSVEPHFKKGGRFEKWHPLYEAVDTFLYSPGKTTSRAPHVRDSMDLKRMMVVVVVALIPCVFMAMFNTGLMANRAIAETGPASISNWRSAVLAFLGLSHDPGSFWANLTYGALYFLPIYVVSMAVGGAWEVLFAMVRRHEVNEGFLVTGLLFPLTLPPDTPLWQVALGISFGVVIGKEIFGGTGRNFLNPALVARTFLYFAYPAQMSGDRVWVAVDGFSRATPLGQLATADVATGMKAVGVSWTDAFLGIMPGSLGETSTLACLIGAAILIFTGVGSWRIMLAMLLGGIGSAAFFNVVGSDTNPMFQMSPAWHLVTGGFAFGLVFMATDPVSAAMTNAGRWIYGAFIGVITILIRVVNPAYPEGVMLAILLGNVFAPVIDYFVVQANIKRRLLRQYGA